jgi:hypothetical protein
MCVFRNPSPPREAPRTAEIAVAHKGSNYPPVFTVTGSAEVVASPSLSLRVM